MDAAVEWKSGVYHSASVGASVNGGIIFKNYQRMKISTIVIVVAVQEKQLLVTIIAMKN